jgi:hypothetical protein
VRTRFESSARSHRNLAPSLEFLSCQNTPSNRAAVISICRPSPHLHLRLGWIGNQGSKSEISENVAGYQAINQTIQSLTLQISRKRLKSLRLYPGRSAVTNPYQGKTATVSGKIQKLSAKMLHAGGLLGHRISSVNQFNQKIKKRASNLRDHTESARFPLCDVAHRQYRRSALPAKN